MTSESKKEKRWRKKEKAASARPNAVTRSRHRAVRCEMVSNPADAGEDRGIRSGAWRARRRSFAQVKMDAAA
jgi:hypothetical protein